MNQQTWNIRENGFNSFYKPLYSLIKAQILSAKILHLNLAITYWRSQEA